MKSGNVSQAAPLCSHNLSDEIRGGDDALSICLYKISSAPEN